MNAFAGCLSLSSLVAAVLGLALLFLPVFAGVRAIAVDAMMFAAVQIVAAGLSVALFRLCRHSPRSARR